MLLIPIGYSPFHYE